jgi:hypothetical protein
LYVLMSLYLFYRNLFLEFGAKVLGIEETFLKATKEYQRFQSEEGSTELLQARILAYASATWFRHASSIKRFLEFCSARELSIFERTPHIINLFLLTLVQEGGTYGMIEASLDGLSFVYRFFNMQNFVLDPMVADVKKFAMKSCEHQSNSKKGFGSAEVRAMWDALDEKFGGVQYLSKSDLRTFMIAVFQHQTFCRYSDLSHIRLSDVFHDIDYFKIHIRYSKTDQGGEGQYVFLPKSATAFRNPHMLMCLYIYRMGFESASALPKVYLFPPLK